MAAHNPLANHVEDNKLNREDRGLFNMVRTLFAAAAACALAGAAQAQTQGAATAEGYLNDPKSFAASAGAIYKACDGYSDPTDRGDGMTTQARWHRYLLRSGHVAVVGCNFAIADLDQAHAKYWMRKVSLLIARAVHRLEDNDIPGAIADLDAAKAAAVDPSEPFFQRSLGAQMQLVRAVAQRRSDDLAGAQAIAIKVSDDRPFSLETAISALTAMGTSADSAERTKLLRRIARLSPGDSGLLYREVFERGDFADAIGVYSTLQPPVKMMPEPIEPRERPILDEENRSIAELFWADAAGRRAYALAALGRSDEAEAALAEAQTRLSAAIPPPPPLPDKPSEKDRSQNAAIEQANLKIRTEGPAALEAWVGLVKARVLCNRGHAADAFASLPNGPLQPTYATIDLLEALAAKLPSQKLPDLKAMRATLWKIQHPNDTSPLFTFFGRTPEAETVEGIPPERRLAKPSETNGYSEDRQAKAPFVQLGYRGGPATLAILEEEAILHAAELAAQEGKDSLVIHVLKNTEFDSFLRTEALFAKFASYTPIVTRYESLIDVEFVDSKSLPADRENERWRLIDAAAVRAALSPLYRVKGAKTAGGAR